MKNIKIKVNQEQNLKVQEKVNEMNKDRAWDVYLGNGRVSDYDIGFDRHAVCVSRNWVGFEYLAIDKDGDLILCWNKDIFDKRPEKEVSFEYFMKKKIKMKRKQTNTNKIEIKLYSANARFHLIPDLIYWKVKNKLIGKIKYSKSDKEYMYYPESNIFSFGEDEILQIYEKLKKLNK